MTPLNELQAQVLGVIADRGSKSVSDVASSLLVSDACARAAINRLEWKGLVMRSYTTAGRSKFVVSVTRRGADLAAEIFRDEDGA